MMTKSIKYTILSVVACSMLVSCSNYLDVNLQGNQLTMEETFSKRATAERYLAHVYSYLSTGFDILNGDYSVVSRSDEALLSYTYGAWNNFRQGAFGVSSNDYHIWASRYQGISQATIFMDNILNVEDLSAEQKVIMKAEARFLRAYYYFTLLRQYGPVYVWGDQMPDQFIDAETVDRHTVEQNVDFILSEYDKAIWDLPEQRTSTSEYGRITKGTAMAAKAELLLYAARPLFNGCALYRGEMMNLYGDYLFPQTPDPNKWDLAAKAAKEVIDLKMYDLYNYPGVVDPFEKAMRSYMGVFFEKWNNEVIWGKWASATEYGGFYQRALPRTSRLLGGGNSGTGASLKLVDTYPMASTGRYPVTGYDGVRPIVDRLSGYEATGFTDNWTHPLDKFATFKAHNSLKGRDARFYTSVLANGMYWIENSFQGTIQLTFFNGGTASYYSSQECLKSGFLWRRFSDPGADVGKYAYGNIVWPYYRLAEIYLNYAEACNEKPDRDEAEALKYMNLVRARSGLNKIEEAYPEVIGNQTLLRELLRKERMVELAFEGKRYYDVRTWMIAEQEFNYRPHTLNLAATNYEDSWERVDDMFEPGRLVFEPKHYFLPIHENQQAEMRNITQNYGW
ncbi:RagB/SusD family nutrient uptake outer membrane protein [Proteiniphilum sp. X52]|uniref:RagB/SusD family nutrient uptake outer membrane protein n=1 Tax=Proteiniphilum sp. X52 TaxID=2382159 RepID=UPI000F0A70E8|nr:RagB/SusD family nutrient uptake outer membrane protein [Proteiniphilum sp. X52]RNC66794.1 RagB/SusD family nutrient uptake outer membrane protein [Proteiniphilum sp. X52]